MFEAIKKVYSVIEKFCVIYTFVTIVLFVFIYFNWVPGYYFERHKTDSIKPLINLFPGQKIRFDMGFYEPSPEIVAASWKISNGSVHFDDYRIKPTFTLPATKGGTYILTVTAKTIDGQLRSGQSILNVVDDKPVTVQLKAPVEVIVTSQDVTPGFLSEIKASGVEIYSGNGQWTTVKNVTVINGGASFGLQPNDNVSLFGDKVLIRAQGNTSNLAGYGSALMPAPKTQHEQPLH